ncbi:sorbitol dehydrogenase [bacterium BMS3Bbin03]|nr:sorbitol dehydrogenase [bacterium BMS3Bbin03]
MKAAVLKDIGEVDVTDVPFPKIEADEVLIRVAVAGICGSDVHGFSTGLYEPGIVMGHEFSGTVADVGKEALKFKKGDRVTSNPVLACGKCSFCKAGKFNLCDDMGTIGITHPGAFAEFIKVPEQNVVAIGHTDFEKAAFCEPLSVVVHACEKSGIHPAEKCLVIGGGTIGNLLTRVLKLKGVEQVVLSEPDDFRRKIAQKYADAVLNPFETDPMDFCEKEFGQLPDVVFECVGLPATIQEAVQDVIKGGRVIILGVSTESVEMDFLDMMYNEKAIQSVFSCTHEFMEAADLIRSGAINPLDLATSRIALSEISGKGFKKLTGENHEIKILVNRFV